MMQTVAEGWWCRKCDMFHDDDDCDPRQDVCQMCGCAGSEHIRVEIVTK